MKRWRHAAAAIVFFGLLTACSGKPQVDPNAVDAAFSTEPAPPVAGSPAKLSVVLTGVDYAESVTISLDIRSGDRTAYVDAVPEDGGRFTSTYTFPEKGVYDVYLHLYIDDLHLTKKRQVEAL